MAGSKDGGAKTGPNKSRLGVSAFAICAFIFTLGSNGVRNLIGWPGFILLAVTLVVTGIVLFVRLKPERFRWYRLPAPLYWFLLVIVLSIFWSQYRFETVLGVTAQLATTVLAVVLAFLLSWQEVLRTLGTALRYLIGLSLLFELWVSLVVREPLRQNFLPSELAESKSKLLLWSRDLLFSGGPIQGLVANSVMLGFIALLGLIIFSIQLRAGLVRRFNGWFWVGLSVCTLLLTRGATVWVALIAVIVGLVVALWARRLGPERRVPLYIVSTALVTAAVAITLFAREFVFGLLGKSGDLTGRVDIWDRVIHLAEQRPWFGWGWVSYWAPWVEPFKSLDVKKNAATMSAHNTWLDVWLQIGIVGVLVFAPLVVLTIWRVWFRAVDPPRRGYGPALPYATSSLWPFLIMIALVVQSLTESRLLIEGNWVLLVLLAVKSRFDFVLPSSDIEHTRLPWRRVPIVHDTGQVELSR
ncbi:O-antigen ligase family protein [Leucobacter coleopterorum]|uniref:O-antigen ligase family protein n=1 Tax=Leucobacter coleopterorum TaxID=2714933 RepID=A0ABX6JY81_9MICO|nr:O-antigen ligase family protein [Leucobacter coleopterorum]QIM19273.1 O-antigen ligase family protein [Leucobacter coleopterorum]